MGILNVTPDSFSDGGAFLSPREALMHAHRMAAAGADIIDVGGESTRPGAAAVSVQQELDRVIPVIEALWAETRLPISIDTSKAEVMREAAAAGAGMINDVRALRGEDAVETAAELALPVCLMHMQGEPGSMQREPRYDDVCAQVTVFLLKRAEVCVNAGIARENIVLDPGFGFGKLLEHNLALLRGMATLCEHGFPLLAGLSRKSMIAQITGREVSDRLAGSLALALLAAQQGASIIRVHDVSETADVISIFEAFRASLPDPA